MSFAQLADYRRNTVRAPVNPLDKSTIVSIYPKEIKETKHTIQPGYFEIPAGTYLNPAILVVGPSSWWKEIDEQQPILEIPTSSIHVADSVVKDYCNGLLACDMSTAMPGLFYVPGEHTVKNIKDEYRHVMDKAAANQKRWYEALVKLADGLWARSNGSPLTISDDMRNSAKELNLNNKDWMADFQSLEMIRCVACGALRNPLFPICGSCHAIIDKDKAKELGLIFAQ